MTDTELSALEAKAKAATPGPWYAYTDGSIVWEQTHEIHTAVCDSGEKNKNNAAFIAAVNPIAVLDLIAELRQARKERDWVIQNIRPTDVGPTACPTKEIWYNCDEGLKTPRNKDVCHKCWLDAAKEAVSCQAKP